RGGNRPRASPRGALTPPAVLKKPDSWRQVLVTRRGGRYHPRLALHSKEPVAVRHRHVHPLTSRRVGGGSCRTTCLLATAATFPGLSPSTTFSPRKQRGEPGMIRQNPAAPLRVLVVDDCPDTTWSMSLLLRAWGHDTSVAGDGPTALTLADSFRPDVVLLDI